MHEARQPFAHFNVKLQPCLRCSSTVQTAPDVVGAESSWWSVRIQADMRGTMSKLDEADLFTVNCLRVVVLSFQVVSDRFRRRRMFRLFPIHLYRGTNPA